MKKQYFRRFIVNKEKIKERVLEMLDESVNVIKEELIDKVLDSAAVDVEGWDEKCNSMILPKSILIALLQREVDQYSATGTIKNIRCFV